MDLGEWDSVLNLSAMDIPLVSTTEMQRVLRQRNEQRNMSLNWIQHFSDNGMREIPLTLFFHDFYFHDFYFP
jgi:hypothetical protein